MLEITKRKPGDMVTIDTTRGETCQIDVIDPDAGRVSLRSTVRSIRDGTIGLIRGSLRFGEPFVVEFGNGRYQFGPICGMTVSNRTASWLWEF